MREPVKKKLAAPKRRAKRKAKRGPIVRSELRYDIRTDTVYKVTPLRRAKSKKPGK